jgi:hypothetical protein
MFIGVSHQANDKGGKFSIVAFSTDYYACLETTAERAGNHSQRVFHHKHFPQQLARWMEEQGLSQKEARQLTMSLWNRVKQKVEFAKAIRGLMK